MGGSRKKGRTVKKNLSTAGGGDEDASLTAAPHSFVIHRGKNVGKCVQDLTKDFRQVMEPFTASDVKVRRKNVIKDFVHVAGLLKVSHLMMFTQTEKGPYLKIGRFPRGPTLTFKIQNYTLSRDVRSSLKRQITYDKQFANHALLIMNNFSGNSTSVKDDDNKKSLGSREVELMSSMFQNMFPTINVTKVKLNSIRRCVLMNYNSTDGTVDFRHYTIKVVPVGMTRGVKKIVAQSKIPNMSRFENMAEYLETGGGNASESEAEGDESTHVTLSQNVSSRGNTANAASSIKLVELGPRLTLEPIKIEEGLLDGEVLYHKLIEKTEAEKAKIKAARLKKKNEKEARKKLQEKNVKRKELEKEKHKEKSLAGMKKRTDLPEGFKSAPDSDEGDDENEEEEDDDAEWYRKEVGENPDKDLFDGIKPGSKRGSGQSSRFLKKFKKSPSGGNKFNKSRDSSANRKSFNKKGGDSTQFKRKGDSKFGGGREGRKPKRPTDVYNSQGLGPNFNKSRPNKGPRVTATKKKYRTKK